MKPTLIRGFLLLMLAFPGPAPDARGGRPGAGGPTGRAFPDSLRRVDGGSVDSAVNVIVEFAGDPMFLARMKSPGPMAAVSAGEYLSRFERFAADADAILQSSRSAGAGRAAIRHRYYKAFFGVGATIPARMIPQIHRLPYVRAVHDDREVRASLEPAIELVGAPAVWAGFGTQGGGIRVGVIDSGIDYLHPALGGGFGTGFKVAGGYDIVNDDGDPMDDNGHGTHVAGLVAADADTIKGVAPQATLYAYKALDAAGRGLDSWVIDAIERAVDPDGNGDPADRLDVVNASLGSDEGSPTDPASVAADNAVRLGVVFCAAAGNTGGRTPVQGKEDNYFFDGSATINTPGTSELAITVGASELSDTLARFSSRGPNRASFSIKPEVLAPGVGIGSTYPGGGTAKLSGTSMATPMVAGVAALIRSVHPSWSPAMIKSAIVNKARDAGLSAYLQGGGRVRAVNSVSAKTLVDPPTLGYGLDPPAALSWIAAETLRVYNVHDAGQTYTAAAGGMLPGIALFVSPPSFSIPANDSLSIIVTLSVNNALIAVADEDILRFTGGVAFNGSVDTARVPWAFVRTNRLVVTTSEPAPFFLGYSNAAAILSTTKTVTWTSPTRAEVYAPLKGTYEFFTLFRDPAGTSKIVIEEGVSINDDDAGLFLDAGLAVNPLVYRGVDHQGNPLSGYRAPRRALITTLPNFGNWVTTFSGGSDTVLLSAVSNTHSFRPVEFQFDLVNTMTFHAVQYDRFPGMNGPRTAANSPADFIREQFRVKLPPGTPEAANIAELYSYTDAGGTGQLGGLGFDVDTVSVAGDGYAFTGFFGRSSIPSEDLAVKLYTSITNVPGLSIDYDLPFLMTLGDSVVASTRDFVTPAVPRFGGDDTMTFGGPPAHMLVLWYNNTFGGNTLHFRTLSRGMLRETRNSDLAAGTYSLYDGNGALLLTEPLNAAREPRVLTADPYRVVVTTGNHWLRNVNGTVTLTSEFDLGAGLPANPPSVTSFMVLDANGRTAEAFAKNEQAALQFSVNVVNFSSNTLPLFDSTRAWYRRHGASQWTPLALMKIAELAESDGLIVRADLGAATAVDSVAIDLRVASMGADGFTLDQVVSPAFAVGNWDTIATGVNGPPEGGIPRRFALGQNHPNPFNPSTSISYEIPAAGGVVLKVYDLLGREVATLVNERKAPGTYSAVWNASSMPGGVYFCRLRSGASVETRKLVLLK